MPSERVSICWFREQVEKGGIETVNITGESNFPEIF